MQYEEAHDEVPSRCRGCHMAGSVVEGPRQVGLSGVPKSEHAALRVLVGTGVAAGDDRSALTVAVRHVVAAGRSVRGWAVVDDAAELTKDPAPARPCCCWHSSHCRLLFGARTPAWHRHPSPVGHSSSRPRGAPALETSARVRRLPDMPRIVRWRTCRCQCFRPTPSPQGRQPEQGRRAGETVSPRSARVRHRPPVETQYAPGAACVSSHIRPLMPRMCRLALGTR